MAPGKGLGSSWPHFGLRCIPSLAFHRAADVYVNVFLLTLIRRLGSGC